MKTAFVQDPELTAVAIAYKNPDINLIADSVLTRFQVGSSKFSYTNYNDVHTLFGIPETRVGPTSKVNRVTLKGSRVTSETEDAGLEIPLSFYDTNDVGKGQDPRKIATEALSSWISLRREYDTAQLVFDPATYPTDNKTQLAEADQFQTTATSKPLDIINDGLDSMLVRGNVLLCGQLVWRYLRQHPDICKAIHGNSGDTGLVTRQQIADLFELQEVLVGTAWLNTAKPGEEVTMSRVWGAHMAAFYRDRQAPSVGGLTFGATATFGTKISGSYTDSEIGLRGGEVVKTGESTRNLIVAPYAGFFWEDAAAVPE